MIKVTISKKKDDIKAIEVFDHAGYADKGEDIVCSAVSFLTFNTIDTFIDLLDMKDKISYEILEDKIRLEIKDNLTEDQKRDSQLILKKFELGMKSLLQNYSDFVRVNYMEV